MKTALFAFAAASLLAISLQADQTSFVRIDFSNPGLYPSQWTLTVHPDGSGHFHAEGGTKPAEESSAMLPAKVDRDVSLSGDFVGHVFKAVHEPRLMKGQCESHLKVAFQGWKKISYRGPDGEGGCEFNYSKNKEIQDLGDSLVAVGSTLIEGARLELLLQHDPLGLDNAMQYIQEATGDGRLQQICAIRGILERLEQDPHVMERVRKRAHTLLAQANK
jgi:hypothetical protein